MKLKLLGWIGLLGLIGLMPASAQTSVLLAWDANVESTCMGYRLLSGPAPRTYTRTNIVMGRTANAGMVTGVPSGKVFIAVVAFDALGLDSDFSNEVSWTNRLSAPHGLVLTGTIQASTTPTGSWSNLAQVVVPLPPIPATAAAARFFRSNLLLEEAK